MRKIFIAILLGLALFCLAYGLGICAPFLVSDPNPISDNVLNGVYVEMAVNYVGVCSTADVSGKPRVSIPDVANAIRFDVGQVGTGITVGEHWWCVAQVNVFGESAFVPFYFKKAVPASPVNIRIVVP